MAPKQLTCGDKHLKLVIAIMAIVSAICGGTIGYAHSTATGIESRLRTVEQAESANAARFEAIQSSLTRLERMAEERK